MMADAFAGYRDLYLIYHGSDERHQRSVGGFGWKIKDMQWNTLIEKEDANGIRKVVAVVSSTDDTTALRRKIKIGRGSPGIGRSSFQFAPCAQKNEGFPYGLMRGGSEHIPPPK